MIVGFADILKGYEKLLTDSRKLSPNAWIRTVAIPVYNKPDVERNDRSASHDSGRLRSDTCGEELGGVPAGVTLPRGRHQ
jgi:hypothetical protein